MSMTREQTRARARLAANVRHHGSDTAAVDEARDKFDEVSERARLDEHVAAIVAQAPRLTAEQRDSLRRVFRYGPPDNPST